MLEVARQRLPGIVFHQADMVDFNLGRKFDAIVCLFSSIGYVKTVSRLKQTLRNMARHLHPGGVLIVEPWLKPEVYKPGKLHAVFVDQPDLKLARMSISEREGSIAKFDFHFLVATHEGIEYFVEHHEMGLFSHEDYVAAFKEAGLEVTCDSEGLTGRGLYIGILPLEA